MHLDTAFTLCGDNIVTAFTEVTDAMICYDLRPEESGRSHDLCRDPRHMFAVVSAVLAYAAAGV